MNHDDDASINSMIDSPSQVNQSSAIASITNSGLPIKQSKRLPNTLAATQDFETRQADLSESQKLKSPDVNYFFTCP